MENRVCKLFNIRYPVIQGGMIWCSGWKLASAVSKDGGLGLIGAGSMYPDNLIHHIRSCREALAKAGESLTFGVNVPLLYPQIEEIMQIIVREGVPVVFTSAGSPKKWTEFLKKSGITVAHVVSSTAFAVKCQQAGVDAVVAEGFEAGGHNGREETTTMCLVPAVREAVSLPLIAAGGVASRASFRAALALGSDGVQIGTRFALCRESSAHHSFKEMCRGLPEGKTRLLLKKLAPVRLVENEFSKEVQEAENRGATAEELSLLLGSGRAKRGIFEGDLSGGELEIGQCSSMIKREETVRDIFDDICCDYL